jgi:quinol monooxygenase YgiN
MKPEVVFALYRPHEGKDVELRKLIKKHIPTLRRLELVTERVPILVKSKNGTYIEIFEWKSAESSAQAHQHPELAQVWEAMGQIADLPALESLEEIQGSFPHFEPIDL